MILADGAQPAYTLRRITRGIGKSGPALRSARGIARLLGDGEAVGRHARAQCETSIRLARLVGLGERVQGALANVCERWDGKGEPMHLAEGALALVVRVYHAAEVLESCAAEAGAEAALAEVAKRAGGQLDPAVAATVARDKPGMLAALTSPRPYEDFLVAEPEPHSLADAARSDDVATAFAHLADLKSVFTLGHSISVARLCERTARALGMAEQEIALTRRAALLHDIGRVAIPNSIWDKPGSFSIAEWERARLHAYYTERVLWQAPPLRAQAAIASAAHERLDGRGYHRGLPAAMAGLPARVLAVADVFGALSEPRPHRPALDAEAARRVLLEQAREGTLDAAVVRALLDAETGEAPRRAAWPKGLSDREVEVLRLVARGRTNKEIATLIGVSPKTVQHHVAHVYDKIGVESRAAAALFATEAGLLTAS
jgi:HD-GYP domain-containing protein (c-di-GMP phosphodiesterase class II)